MITVHQFTYSADNLGYIIYSDREAVVVDGGDPGYVRDFLERRGLRLLFITNTHTHHDHTLGNRKLQKLTGAAVSTPPELIENRSISVGSGTVDIIHTPGHTEDSICLLCGGSVITGDTLFIANLGNCPGRRLDVFRKSLDTLLALPDETVTYPGHDYTERSLKRALSVEPSNDAIEIFRKKYSPPPVAGSIGMEEKINPYLRAYTPEIARHLKEHGKPVGSPFECFTSFMELY